MGTNYYLYIKPACPICSHADEPLHIGKSSAGWCFSLHVDPDSEIHSLYDWERLWMQPGTFIRNEYGDDISVTEMRLIITTRTAPEQWDTNPYGYRDWEEFHQQNHSEKGPYGLLRHRIDGLHCIDHSAGTWDLITGEFS
mgnify:FL=1